MGTMYSSTGACWGGVLIAFTGSSALSQLIAFRQGRRNRTRGECASAPARGTQSEKESRRNKPPPGGASRLFLSDGLRREEWAVRSHSRKATKLRQVGATGGPRRLRVRQDALCALRTGHLFWVKDLVKGGGRGGRD